MSEAKIIRILTSGVPELVSYVEVYSTLLEKLKEKHPEELERFEEVAGTVEQPSKKTKIHKSKTHEKSIVFVNPDISSNSGDPVRIPIKVFPDGEAS